MPATMIELGIDKMSTGEKLTLIGEIGQSLPRPGAVPIPEFHRQELDRRTQTAIDHPEETASWSAVLERLQSRS